ncbi:AVD: Avidin [Crotalus adamanteus]|uniref:AVD: Avidin n=1 Tax=Crotalus adamanteus TaxID=8729 RepID=A0AAW1B0P8_CROAD
MEINSVGNMGVFSGLYKMAVSASDNPIGPSPLQGIQHQGPQPTFGLTINWNFWLCQKARIVFLCVWRGGGNLTSDGRIFWGGDTAEIFSWSPAAEIL